MRPAEFMVWCDSNTEAKKIKNKKPGHRSAPHAGESGGLFRLIGAYVAFASFVYHSLAALVIAFTEPFGHACVTKTKEIPENGNHKKTYALKSQSLSTSGSAGRRNGWARLPASTSPTSSKTIPQWSRGAAAHQCRLRKIRSPDRYGQSQPPGYVSYLRQRFCWKAVSPDGPFLPSWYTNDFKVI